MISQFKVYILASVVVILATALVMTKYELYSIEKEYSKYKENINEQRNRAILEKTRIEADQKAKYDKATSDYNYDLARLTDVLERLRKARTVPRDSGLPVAGSFPDSMPRTPENPGRSINAITIEARTGSFTYENAMMDALQCSRLIEFVKP